jgi:lysophospholipase L1-like esterase
VLAAVGSFVVWLAFHDWGLIAIAVGTALILLLAIVSNTHADVALVLAGLCLLGTAPPERPLPPTLDPRGGSRVLVAIGDSYMSGEGAASYYAGTDDAGGNQCRRAPTAYAVGLATRESRFDRVLFLACSGARTYNVVRGSDERRYAAVQTGEPGTQIDQLHSRGPSLRPALVIVGLGGNDAGFAMIGEACLAPGDCDTQRLLFVHNLAKVERALVEVYRSLLASLPAGVPVVAVPYPQPIADARRCSGVALSKRERDFVREFVDLLDARVESAARAAGVHYLAEMKHALAVHRVQLCDRRKHAAGVNFVDIASVNGLASQRFSPARWLHNSLHPNERGHDAMRRTLGAWLDAHPEVLAKGSMPEPGAGDVPASALRGSVAAPAPPCGVTDGATTNCRAQVRQWELQQILGLWPSALAVLLGLVVVWLMSIAVISLHPGDGTHRTP